MRLPCRWGCAGIFLAGLEIRYNEDFWWCGASLCFSVQRQNRCVMQHTHNCRIRVILGSSCTTYIHILQHNSNVSVGGRCPTTTLWVTVALHCHFTVMHTLIWPSYLLLTENVSSFLLFRSAGGPWERMRGCRRKLLLGIVHFTTVKRSRWKCNRNDK